MHLDELLDTINRLLAANAAVQRCEEELAAAKQKATTLSEETVPSMMQELGINELKLESGQTITIRPDVYAQIPPDRKEEAFEWLSSHGFGGLIKVDVEASFGRDEREQAVILANELQERGLNVAVEQGVHNQTLKAFIRERLAKAEDIPLDLFGAKPVFTTKVK